VSERYFDVAEIERLIPDLNRIMERIVPANAEVESLAEALETERQRVAVTGGAVIDREAWRRASERLEALRRVVGEGLRAIVELGGVPKDLRLGLVDFPTVREGRVVNLCWKLGETTLRWWHGLDEGYARRKPL